MPVFLSERLFVDDCASLSLEEMVGELEIEPEDETEVDRDKGLLIDVDFDEVCGRESDELCDVGWLNEPLLEDELDLESVGALDGDRVGETC